MLDQEVFIDFLLIPVTDVLLTHVVGSMVHNSTAGVFYCSLLLFEEATQKRWSTNVKP